MPSTPRSLLTAAFAAMAFTTVVIMQNVDANAQQGVPSQGGTPSKQPGPNTAPPSSPSQPGSTTPPSTQPPPDAAKPNQPNTSQPDPGNSNPAGVPPGALPGNGNNGNANNGNNMNANVRNVPSISAGSRYIRPFAFQNPEIESHFTDTSRRLVQLEQRMERSNQDLLKRLGEARALTGERQTTATLDLLQQILQDQAELRRYLVQSRTAWSGDIELPNENERSTIERPTSVPTGTAPPTNNVPLTNTNPQR